MGNITADRKHEQWPGGVVPFEIDDTIRGLSQGLIRTAMTNWEAVTPIQFVARTNEPDYLAFERLNDRCNTHVGRVGGRQGVGCEYPVNPVGEPGQLLDFAYQGDNQVDTVYIGNDGALYVSFTVGPAVWSDPTGLTGTGFAPPGAPVSLAHQAPEQLDAVFVGADGAVYVTLVDGDPTGDRSQSGYEGEH